MDRNAAAVECQQSRSIARQAWHFALCAHDPALAPADFVGAAVARILEAWDAGSMYTDKGQIQYWARRAMVRLYCARGTVRVPESVDCAERHENMNGASANCRALAAQARRFGDYAEIDNVRDWRPCTDDHAGTRELLARALDKIRKLSKIQKRVLALWINGFKLREIAERLRFPNLTAAYSVLQKARARIGA